MKAENFLVFATVLRLRLKKFSVLFRVKAAKKFVLRQLAQPFELGKSVPGTRQVGMRTRYRFSRRIAELTVPKDKAFLMLNWS